MALKPLRVGVEKEVKSESINFIYSVAETVDDVLDDFLGIRPAEHIIEIGKMVSPANVIRRVTGIPKPSEVVDEIIDEIDERIEPLEKSTIEVLPTRRIKRLRRW